MLSIQGQNIITQHQPSHLVSKPTEKPPLPKKKKTIKVLKHQYVSDERKQNILNARFMKKKQQLFDITRENVRLFQKINSQKSVYPHESLHKSYQSNKSLVNSRMTNRSNKSLKKSQISNRSKTSQSSTSNAKNKFFNRATSAKSNQNLPTNNKIIVKDTKRKSLINLKPKNIQQTAKQDIQQFAGLFNIKQEPSNKQRNRPLRIKSTNAIRPIKKVPTQNFSEKKFSQSKQIVINQENDIQIHQQIQAEDWDTGRGKSSRGRSGRMRELSMNEKIPEQIMGSNILVQDESKVNIIACHTEQCLKTSKRSQQSSHNSSSQPTQLQNNKYRKQNIQNLFQIKNSGGIQQRLLHKMGKGNEKVSTKYTNLISKINSELSKHSKRVIKQSTIYSMKSRFIV